MKVSYNITQNKFNASLNQETTEIKVSFKTGYYPFPSDLDLSNYYTKSETYSKGEVDEIISEIPVVDTSNLVPYNGANKDVNIASNYFKTSKGFDFTFDAYNYFNTYHSDYYSTLEFKSKDSSDDNFGYLQITANAEEGFNVNCVDGNGANTNSIQVNINGTSSPKAFVSGEGFKTPFGTSNQALTANGDVFDLNTKADIGDIPTKTSFTHDILVANWTLVSGKYEAVISNAGILANSFVDVIPSNDNVDIVRNAQIYPSVLISEGSVKVYSKFLPSGTISVTVNIN